MPSPSKGCNSSGDLVKINTNASLSKEGWMGLGAVAREEGKVLLSL